MAAWPIWCGLSCPEFTSLCPMTGQPDFAHLVVDYVPDGWIVESKSFKLFLTSFRNHGSFHEDCTLNVGRRLVDLLAPTWLRIGGYWYPRGGIPIDVFWQTSAPPNGVWLPSQDVPAYRGAWLAPPVVKPFSHVDAAWQHRVAMRQGTLEPR